MCGPTASRTVDIDALPHPSEWPNRPIFLGADDRVVKVNGYDIGQSLPLGKAIEFETDLFKGCFYLRLESITPDDENDLEMHTAYFNGRKRFYQFVIQGQFKENNLTFEDVVFGDFYDRPLKGIPHGRLGKLLKKFMEAISPGIIFDIFDDKQPKVLAPLGSHQTISVDLPGQQPTDFENIIENTTLLGNFGSREERRKILSKPKYAQKYPISTEHVYTIEGYDHTMDFGTFHQVFIGGIKKQDLVPSLDGQALSLGMYSRKLRCFFRFPLWHERQLQKLSSSE